MTKETESDLLRGRNQRTAIRGNVRDQIRDPMREGRGGTEVRGRNGEVLTRSRKDDGIDEFDVPKEIIPEGWDYQWVAVSITGNSDVVRHHYQRMYQNGWRGVPAERHDGRWTAPGHKGEIIWQGQMLMERPKELSDEAKAESEAKARRQMRDRDEALMGGKANIRGSGIEMSNKYRGTGGNLKMQIDPALDVPAPGHQLAEPGE